MRIKKDRYSILRTLSDNLPLDCRGPIEDHSDGRSRGFAGAVEIGTLGTWDQEFLTVRRNGILKEAAAGVTKINVTRVEEFYSGLEFKGRVRRIDLHGRHLVTERRQEEELFAVLSPSGTHSSIDGELVLSFSRREGSHIDLVRTGFVRCVGNPLPVGRNLGMQLVEISSEQRRCLLRIE